MYWLALSSLSSRPSYPPSPSPSTSLRRPTHEMHRHPTSIRRQTDEPCSPLPPSNSEPTSRAAHRLPPSGGPKSHAAIRHPPTVDRRAAPPSPLPDFGCGQHAPFLSLSLSLCSRCPVVRLSEAGRAPQMCYGEVR